MLKGQIITWRENKKKRVEEEQRKKEETKKQDQVQKVQQDKAKKRQELEAKMKEEGSSLDDQIYNLILSNTNRYAIWCIDLYWRE